MENNQELTYSGTIVSIGPRVQVTDAFEKQEVVISNHEDRYPQHVLFEFQQKNCDKLVNYKVGSLVSVSFNLRGRQWTDPKDGKIKTFNTLAAWRIAAVSVDRGNAPSSEQPSGEPKMDDDLPF